MSNEIIGNTTSIMKTIGLIIAGYLISLLTSHGLNLNGQETQITEATGVIIGSLLSYLDMKYTNTLFKKTITIDDYINYGLKNFDMTVINDTDTPEYTDLILNHKNTTPPPNENNEVDGA